MRELVPGTNVNAFILTQVVENALTIPKAAVRRDGGIGVFVLQPDNTVRWQPITDGCVGRVAGGSAEGRRGWRCRGAAVGPDAEERRKVNPVLQ